jgi:phage portal protein BeeE
VDRFRRPSTRALPTPESVSWMATSWGKADDTERIAPTFKSYSADGYGANGMVFAILNTRLTLVSQAEFRYQDRATGKFTGSSPLLDRPWPNGQTGDLIARMVQDVDLAGNAFVWKAEPDRLVRLRPDSVGIVNAWRVLPDGREWREVIGYTYADEALYGTSDPVFMPVEEVAHWAPIPDPLAEWRGMSWLTPVLREVTADGLMTKHRETFYTNAATPNLMLKYERKLDREKLREIADMWRARHGGPAGAGGTVVLDEGADLTVVGSSFRDMQYDVVQAAGVDRIAAAAGLPVTMFRADQTYENYGAAVKFFANGTAAHLWRTLSATLEKLVDVPEGSRLWHDTANIPALQEAETARAEASVSAASAINTLILAGFKADEAVSAVNAGDLSLLLGAHSGLVSVQMQAPGTGPDDDTKDTTP